MVDYQIRVHGSDAKPHISMPSGNQQFINNVHNGLEILVQNIVPYLITWGDTLGVLRGLRQIYQVSFELVDFEVSVPSGIRIGKGKIKLEDR